MDTFSKLPNIFSAHEAEATGIRPYDLRKAVTTGFLDKIHRGVYRKASAPDGGMWEVLLAATKRIPTRCSVGLISALSYYGLTDTIPEVVWLLADHTTRSSQSGLSIVRLRSPHWDVGISNEDGLHITTIERTFVELIAYKTRFGADEAFISLKEAVSAKRTHPYDVLIVARSMGLERRILPSLEPLLYER